MNNNQSFIILQHEEISSIKFGYSKSSVFILKSTWSRYVIIHKYDLLYPWLIEDISQGFEPLLSHYSIHHFMNEEINSCEREPYFDQWEIGPFPQDLVFSDW